MIVVCIFTLLLCMAIPVLARSREQVTETLCVYSLQRIENAKALWYSELGQDPEEQPTEADLRRYFQHETFPKCPEGGQYDLGDIEHVCTCSLGEAGHVLEEGKLKKPKKPKKK
jgi:hypothetical protein